MRVRIAAAVCAVCALAGMAEETAWRRQETFQRGALSYPEGTVLSDDGDGENLLYSLEERVRRETEVEAEVTFRERLAKTGWSLAGVTLHQDDKNFWTLALVEGPDGGHSIDFLENHAGVWQAQNEPATALKREGSVSFAWKSGVAYRLRLAFRAGRVCASVEDAAEGGRVLSSASFALGTARAVRSGRPGLIVRGCKAAFLKMALSVPEKPTALPGLALEEGVRGRLALLDDALPGHDRAANARLAATLTAQGFGVTRLTAEQFVSEDVLAIDRFSVLVLPQCASLPAQAAERVAQFAREGGHTVFIGGPFLDRPLWRVDGRWIDDRGRAALAERVVPGFRPFVIDSDMDLSAWRRSCSDAAAKAAFCMEPEGPVADGPVCLRLDIDRLQGWEVRHSPELKRVFGEGHDFLTFQARCREPSAQLAVEIIERDGSRWIAVAELSNAWRRVGLPVGAFRFWPDSGTKRRGGAGDRLNPEQAVRVCFGMSSSHTPAMVGAAHTVWLADIGTARDPFAAAGLALPAQGIALEGAYPRYKTHTVTGEVTVAGAPRRDVVCAIPRTLGEGVSVAAWHGPMPGGVTNGMSVVKGAAKWRFLPLAEARRADGATGGVCEWLLLNTHPPMAGAAFAGFGYNDPAVWSSPAVLSRVAATAVRLSGGAVFETAGTSAFAYQLGEPVPLGVRILTFGTKPAQASFFCEILRNGRSVWKTGVTQEPGDGGHSFTWQPPAEPGVYTFHAKLTAKDGGVDEISHEFAVLDPKPAPRENFITVKDGDFWLKGKKWYPVGVNYWPLYVSGMEPGDYQSGWLRDAYYAPALVERDLEQLAGLGVNLVSIQTPPPSDYRNLLDFLRRCERRGIYANLYLGQASPLAFKDAELARYITDARLAGNAAVFAYDTIWEPGNSVFKDDAARGRWDADWRAWIDERYGSLARAEKDWGVPARRAPDGAAVSPPDAWFREDGAWRVQMAAYRRFMDTLTDRLWGRANRRLRELDPNHLISFRQGNTLPHDFALSGPVRHIDFICPEGYSIPDTDAGEDAIGFITRYVDFTTGGKPVVWSEFGVSVWDGGRMRVDPVAVERQGRYSERFYRAALASGAAGTVPWWWVGGYRVEERSDFGIVEPDRAERPAARLIRTYGPLLRTPRAKPVPDEWFTFDRDAHAGGYWRAAFHEGAAAYRAAAAAGRTLGVRSPGTGLDSANVPLVAVGNVPCDGTNPPKYLDAAFNRLQVRDAAGVWREATNGAVIAVSGEVRVRASVGNTQEATWLAEGAGGVRLSVGDPAFALPGGGKVPPLADADFGEFVLPQTVASPLALTARMKVRRENRPDIPFGEKRTFTVVPTGAGRAD
ncbi:MAG: hypothetical protein LBW77_01600 [Verrucomicrobiota bacterium]|jgi:hypothetical protein|nr:hypothetical protein [Verrucomicrobiota bacterium]